MYNQISVVIPTYNAEKTIGKTLEACLNQDYTGRAEIIVVDDGSTDGTREVVSKYPVSYIYQENSGPAAARNKGWRVGSGEIICFTDSDCIPHRDWLSKLLRNYQNDDTGAVGGSYTIANPESLLACCTQQEITFRHSTMPSEVRFLGSYNLSIKRSVLEAVSGFEEGYRKASAEDNDLSYKMLKHGYRLRFDREVLVAHFHPDRLWKYLKDQYSHGFWRAKLYKDYPGMSRGDDYTQWKDILEILACGIIVVLMPFVWIPSVAVWLLFVLFLYLSMQAWFSLEVFKQRKDGLILFFFLVTSLRGFARTLGFIKGMVKFGYLPYPIKVER